MIFSVSAMIFLEKIGAEGLETGRERKKRVFSPFGDGGGARSSECGVRSSELGVWTSWVGRRRRGFCFAERGAASLRLGGGGGRTGHRETSPQGRQQATGAKAAKGGIRTIPHNGCEPAATNMNGARNGAGLLTAPAQTGGRGRCGRVRRGERWRGSRG
jgi:hypothetical protein